MGAKARREDALHAPGRDGADLHGPRGFADLLPLVIAAIFVLFFTWASWATLDEVTRGEGRMIPSSRIQVVQNQEGGIVSQILVREGAIVERGQALLKIDNIRAASDLRENRKRYLALVGALARLRAEVEDREIVFTPELLADAGEVACNEHDLYDARQGALRSELAILTGQATQREHELAELQRRLTQLERSHGLALEEMAITEPLAARRVVPQIDLLRLKRQVNDLEGELETTRLGIERVRAASQEALSRIEEKSLSFRAEAQRELNVVQAEAGALEEKIAADTDRVGRTEVRSPVRGTIKQLFVNALGGVVQPGEDLAEIVPLEDTLLVEAKVRPADIAFLRPGLPATVKVTADDFSIYGGLDAVVEDIGADTITDEEGERFYRIRVRTTDSTLDNAGDSLPIIPGMTTQIDILTGEKTVMDYLLKPILRAQQNALREH